MHILQIRHYNQKISLNMFRKSLLLHISIYKDFMSDTVYTSSHTSSQQTT